MPDPFAGKSVGPYLGVFLDEVITKELANGLKRNFRLIGHRAYNANGLMGSEYNGLVVLDQDAKQVLVDKLCQQSSGYSEALEPAVRKEVDALKRMGAYEFETNVTANINSRFCKVILGLQDRQDGPVLWRPAGVRARRVTMALILKKLNGHLTFSYSSDAKADFHYYLPLFFRRVAKQMELKRGEFEIRKNAGGSAVSGEVYLELDGLYLWAHESWSRAGGIDITYRTTPRKGASSSEHGHNNTIALPTKEADVAGLVAEFNRVRKLGYQPNLHG